MRHGPLGLTARTFTTYGQIVHCNVVGPVRLVTCVLLMSAATAHAVELNGAARAWLGPGLDTNPGRDVIATPADGYFYGLLQLEGAADFERVHLGGTYDLGARKFLTESSQDTVVQNAQLEALVALGKVFSVGLTARGRIRSGAERDYTDLQGQALVEFMPDAKVDVRLLFGAHRFLYWPSFGYSHGGPEGSVQARYRFDRRHSLSVFGTMNLRTYNALTHVIEGDPDPAPQVVRADTVLSAGLNYSYRGPFHLGLGYSYFDEASNSHGESIRRHRLSALFGLKLPWQLTVIATAAAQLALYPDRIYLSTNVLLLDEDENSSSVTLKVARKLTEHIDVDVRYALYVNLLPQSNFLYLRQVASAGVSIAFE
jgi:hypothetical protein